MVDMHVRASNMYFTCIRFHIGVTLNFLIKLRAAMIHQLVSTIAGLP